MEPRSSDFFVVSGVDVGPKDPVMIFASSNSDDSKSNGNEEISFSLSRVASILYATVIEDALLCLYFLRDSNNTLRIQKTVATMKSLFDGKFGIARSTIKGYHDAIRYPLDSAENKLKKLSRDNQYVEDTLLELYVELCLDDSFKGFLQKIHNRENHFQLVQKILDDEAAYKLRIRELRKIRRTQHNIHRLAVNHQDARIHTLQDNIDDTNQLNLMKQAYTHKWQKSRLEQQEKKLQDIEDVAVKNIHHYQAKEQWESRAHNEVDFFNCLVIAETERKVEEMMEKYDRDMEDIEVRVQKGKTKYYNILESRIAMEKKIKKHSQDIINWHQFKEEREQKELYKKRMHDSAVTVQAWWRGILKRRGLGPFRPKKSKKASGMKI